MTSQIDPTLPVTGTPTTASVRGNFQTAHDEITALQAAMTDITASEVAITPAIGALGTTVQAALTTLNNTTAPLASPNFTGDPKAPTAASGDSDASIASTAFVQAAVAPALNNVGRNLLHNSMFNIAQRGGGVFSAAATWIYTYDRWKIVTMGPGDNYSVARPAAADADRTAIGDESVAWFVTHNVAGAAGAGNGCLAGQAIENVRRLSGKTVTVSFWAQMSIGAKIGVSFAQDFGSGGSPSAAVPSVGQSVTAVSAAWTRYALTFNLPSAAGKTFGTDLNDSTSLEIWLSAGSTYATRSGGVGVQTGFFNLWGVQLEIGSVATPLEKPDPQQDLAKCQRFFKYIGVTFVTSNVSGAYLGYAVSLGINMRAIPTVVWVDSGSTGVSAPFVNDAGGDHVSILAQSTSTGTSKIYGLFSAAADL